MIPLLIWFAALPERAAKSDAASAQRAERRDETRIELRLAEIDKHVLGRLPPAIDTSRLAARLTIEIDGSIVRRYASDIERDRESYTEVCRIPAEDLLIFLNRLPGPALKHTDVVQRLRAEPWAVYPNEELKAGCLVLYENEKAHPRRRVAESTHLCGNGG
jgi:hypothetical protein